MPLNVPSTGLRTGMNGITLVSFFYADAFTPDFAITTIAYHGKEVHLRLTRPKAP